MLRINEFTAAFTRAGLDELMTDTATRRLDATIATATFELRWCRSILEEKVSSTIQ